VFLEIPLHWMWWPAIGGIAVGLGGLEVSIGAGDGGVGDAEGDEVTLGDGGGCGVCHEGCAARARARSRCQRQTAAARSSVST